MMKLGIDARLLSGPITGIGRYTEELTKELVKNSGEFYLYSSRPIISESFQQKAVIKTKNFHTRIGRMLWSQTYLPYWASYDKINVFWGPAHRIPRFLAHNIARVVTIHDLVWKHAGDTMRGLNKILEKKLMPEAIYLADRIIADSHHTAKDISNEFPIASSKIRVIYPGPTNFILAGDFKALANFGIHARYILFVGTLEPRKNLERLLRAFSLVDSAHTRDLQLVIVGGKGWGNLDINALIRELDLSSKVVLTGYVTDEQLSTLYAHAYFLAIPSIYEGFGLPIVEANTYGIPVLTSNRSCLPEVAGDSGVLVDPFDIHSIAFGITTLLKNLDYRNKLAEKAILNAKRFSWERAGKETWGVLEEAIEERQRKL